MGMDVPQKRCSKCKGYFPASREFFSPHKLTSDGLETRCKACIREKNHQYLEENRDKEKARKKKWREDNPDKVRDYNKQYRIDNQEKVLAAVKKWGEDNREYVLGYNKHYREINRQKERERGREYYWNNRDQQLISAKQWREDNPDRVRELDREWKAKNPEKTLVIKQRRAARKQGLPDTFSDSDYTYMMAYWQGKCAVCGRQVCDGLIIVLDHWIALSDERPDNPGTVPHNMLPMCHSTKRGMRGCNNRKWKLEAVQWVFSQFDEQDARVIIERINEYFEVVNTDLS
jgi:hypothetical protein